VVDGGGGVIATTTTTTTSMVVTLVNTSREDNGLSFVYLADPHQGDP